MKVEDFADTGHLLGQAADRHQQLSPPANPLLEAQLPAEMLAHSVPSASPRSIWTKKPHDFYAVSIGKRHLEQTIDKLIKKQNQQLINQKNQKKKDKQNNLDSSTVTSATQIASNKLMLKGQNLALF